MRAMATGVLAGLALSVLGAVPLHAQEITGVVMNGATGEPVADASVVLMDSKGKLVRGTLTEPDGSYTLACPKAGTYTLRVGGANLETWDSPPIEVKTDETKNYDVRIGGSGTKGLATFHRRREQHADAVFLGPEEVESKGGNQFTDVLRNVKGVFVVPLPRPDTATVREGTNYWTVRLEGSNFDPVEVGYRQPNEKEEDCPPVLYVDGSWWGNIDKASDRGPDMRLLPDELAAIEIYTPSLVPEELNSGREAEDCGVVSVWRKDKYRVGR